MVQGRSALSATAVHAGAVTALTFCGLYAGFVAWMRVRIAPEAFAAAFPMILVLALGAGMVAWLWAIRRRLDHAEALNELALELAESDDISHAAAVVTQVLQPLLGSVEVVRADLELSGDPTAYSGRVGHSHVLLARRPRPYLNDEIGLLEAAIALLSLCESRILGPDGAIARHVDSVTGLPDHRAMREAVAQQIQRAENLGDSCTVLLLDIDNFRFFNDTHGHMVGDLVLRTIAEHLQTLCAGRARVGRYGGDEFLVLVPTGLEVARPLADQIVAEIGKDGFRAPGDERVIPYRVTVGMACFPTDTRESQRLLGVAEQNLKLAQGAERRLVGDNHANAIRREGVNRSTFELLDSMVQAVDNKDSYTRLHSEEVTAYALWIGEELGFPPEEMTRLRIAGLLHDVGKIAIPPEILRKPGRLTDEEFDVMRQHPTIGALIVGAFPEMHDIVDGVLFHHERYDGNGYPYGRAGKDIPKIGRVLAVADAFSAMTTNRPYRRGMEVHAALEQIREGSGTQFDPEFAVAFLIAAVKHWHTLSQADEDELLAA